jgi:hypothetical protein
MAHKNGKAMSCHNIKTENNIAKELCFRFVHFKSRIIHSERSKTERVREGPGLALLAGAHTDIWLERKDLCTPLLLCPGKEFRQVK